MEVKTISTKNTMQPMVTTATYDAVKNIVIPQKKPVFNNFKEVVVLFMPQKEELATDKIKRFDAVKKVWAKNVNIDPKEAAQDIEQAIVEARSAKAN